MARAILFGALAWTAVALSLSWLKRSSRQQKWWLVRIIINATSVTLVAALLAFFFVQLF